MKTKTIETPKKTDLELAIENRIENWKRDWGVIAQAFVDELGLTKTEAIAYLQLSELASIRDSYNKMANLQKKYLPLACKMMEKGMEELEEGDDWRGDKDE